MADLEIGVELLADAVADEVSDDAEPVPSAWSWMARPISLIGWPGLAASMPSQQAVAGDGHQRGTAHRPADEERGVGVAVDASLNSVTSRLTMSPSARGRSSGMPWQITR